MLYSVIKQKGGEKYVRVGIVAKNDMGEIMLVNEKIDRINKSIMNIPYVDVKEFKEENIISEFSDKYGIRINGIKNYINEASFLDDMCNERLQVNMTCNIEDKIDGVKWIDSQDILVNENIPNGVKQCIEVYNYNINNEKL